MAIKLTLDGVVLHCWRIIWNLRQEFGDGFYFNFNQKPKKVKSSKLSFNYEAKILTT